VNIFPHEKNFALGPNHRQLSILVGLVTSHIAMTMTMTSTQHI